MKEYVAARIAKSCHRLAVDGGDAGLGWILARQLLPDALLLLRMTLAAQFTEQVAVWSQTEQNDSAQFFVLLTVVCKQFTNIRPLGLFAGSTRDPICDSLRKVRLAGALPRLHNIVWATYSPGAISGHNLYDLHDSG